MKTQEYKGYIIVSRPNPIKKNEETLIDQVATNNRIIGWASAVYYFDMDIYPPPVEKLRGYKMLFNKEEAIALGFELAKRKIDKLLESRMKKYKRLFHRHSNRGLNEMDCHPCLNFINEWVFR